MLFTLLLVSVLVVSSFVAGVLFGRKNAAKVEVAVTKIDSVTGTKI